MPATIADRLPTWLAAIRRGPFKHAVRALLSSCLGLTLLLSCSRAPLTSQAAANNLSVSIGIQDHTPTAAQVTMLVAFSQAGQTVTLGGNLGLVCNGLAVPPASVGSADSYLTLPRQPDGDAYHCLYTDAHSKQTPLTFQIPQGRAQITSPAPGATLQITEPLYTSVNTSRSPGMVTAVTIRYVLPPPPSDASVRANAVAVCATRPPSCVSVRGDLAPATGTSVLTDATLPYGEGFETFPSGLSSELRLFYYFDWSPPAGGFQAVHLNYANTLITPVTWSRD